MSRALHRAHRAQQFLLRPSAHHPLVLQGRQVFFDSDRPQIDKKDEHSWLWHLINGSKLAKVGIKQLIEEWKEKLKMDWPRYYPGDIVPQFNFREQKDRDLFTTVADSEFNLGFSKCEFIGTRQSTGLFRGFLDTRVPRDGKTAQAGYAALQGLPITKSFERQTYLNWAHWSHLVIRCRGDGRMYMIQLHALEIDEITSHMLYTFPLHTRGGPYWQITTIPFSKFFVLFRSTIQDRQNPPELRYITKIGISLKDKMSGPFELEVDYIACAMNRADEDETFAYETYEVPNNYGYAYGMQ